VRATVGAGLPTGDFSNTGTFQGGFANPGTDFQFGLQFRFIRGVSLVAEGLLGVFPQNEGFVSMAGDPDATGQWKIQAYTISLRTDFADKESQRVFMMFGFGPYTGDAGMATGPLGTSEKGKSKMSFSAGMGVIFLFPYLHTVGLELGGRLHLPTLDYTTLKDHQTGWLSLNAGLVFGIF
jgi:hypothetical protein